MRCLQILSLLLTFAVPAFSQETPAAKLVTALERMNAGGAIEVRATVRYKNSLLVQGILAGKDFDLAWKAEDGSITRQIALGDHAWLSYDAGKKWKAIEPDDRLVYNIVHSPIRVADLDTLPAYEELGTEQRNGEIWLHIRFKTPGHKGTRFVHTLNGTAVAVSRAILAILENNQQADGSVLVPEALRPWVGKERIGPR